MIRHSNPAIRFMAGSVVCWAVAAALAVDPAAPPKFAKAPTVAKTADGGFKIEFAVDRETDVAVGVLAADGKTVRHLAAGMLGPNAPAPLTKGALAQDLSWDGKDDLGQPVCGGPPAAAKPSGGAGLKVRVQLGFLATLDKYLGFDGNNRTIATRGLAVGKDGELYVLEGEQTQGRTVLKVLDRDGRYVRTIIPYPANTPKERLRSVGQLEVDGEALPIVFNGHGGNLYPLIEGMARQTMTFSPKGYLVMVSALATHGNHGPPRHLLALHPEGGAPEGVNFVGPRIRAPIGFMGGAGERDCPTSDHVACSPDGEYIYLTQKIGSPRFTQRHGVFRLKWTDKEAGAPFVGQDEPGTDDGHFNSPEGLAVDAAGNLYVCDNGNNRVMIFSADGKFLDKVAVEAPEQIAVHRVTGEIVVLSRLPTPKGKAPLARLTQFSSYAKGAPREELNLPETPIDIMALDPVAQPPRLWIAQKGGWRKSGGVALIEEKGGKWIPPKALPAGLGLDWPRYVAADPVGKRVLVRERHGGYVEVDPDTGKVSFPQGPWQKDEVCFDPAGNLYAFGGYGSNKILRFDNAGKPLPFSATGSNALDVSYHSLGPTFGARGMCFGPDGTIYVRSTVADGEPKGAPGTVMVFSPDGKLRNAALVDGLRQGDAGVGVDAAGNLYLGINRRLEKQPYPPGFAGQVPAFGWQFWKMKEGKREAPWCYPFCNAYLYHMGAIFKFGPGGGKLAKESLPDAVEYSQGYLGVPDWVQGSQWSHLGFGPIPASAGKSKPSGDPGCQCMSGRFASDYFGRVYMPNPFTGAVEVLDAIGNLIQRGGRYGNPDSAGPGSKVPQPEIAFAFPVAASVRGDSLFVADIANQRLAAVRLASSASAECAVP